MPTRKKKHPEKIIKTFQQWKELEAGKEYPAELLNPRRNSFLQSVRNLIVRKFQGAKYFRRRNDQ